MNQDFNQQQYNDKLAQVANLAVTYAKDNLMFPTGLVGFNLGTANPLTIGIYAENQWVCLFCCQS